MKSREIFDLAQFLMLTALLIAIVTTGCELIDMSSSEDTFIQEQAGGDFVKITVDSQGNVVPTVGDSNNDEGGGVITGDDADSNLDLELPAGGSE